MTDWVTIAKTDEVAEGEMIGTTIDGVELLVAKVDGEYRAIGSVCTHEGGDLAEGWIDGREVTCPLHGSMFDLATGEAVGPPAEEPVPVFEVRVDGNEVQVARPGTAQV
jgi:glycine betaine catabolism B